jgi:8-oxo-dGTP diphosphatase
LRRFGKTPNRGQAYKIRPGAYAILPRGNEALVTFQSEPEPEFQLPGGGIDPGESPVTALHREVLEETGWRISTPRRIGAFRRHVYMPDYDIWAEKVCAIYIAHPVRELTDPTEPHHTAIWAPLDMVSDMLADPGNAAFMRHVLRG